MNGVGLLKRDIRISFVDTFSDKLREQFYSELAVLLESGMDLKSSLELFISNIRKNNLRKSFNNVHTNMIK
jgi:type IV pilus assembly protein PilC